MGRPATPAIERFMAKVKKTKTCWLWTASTIRDYGQFKDGRGMTKAHRFSYAYFVGKIPNGKLVLHKCDNPSCVNPKHLFVGTHLRNQQDKWSRGRGVPCVGQRNGMFGKRPWNKGKKWSAKIRAKISKAAIGRPAWNKGIHVRQGWSPK